MFLEPKTNSTGFEEVTNETQLFEKNTGPTEENDPCKAYGKACGEKFDICNLIS